MPRWIDDPTDSDDHPPFRIVRTPADKALVGIVTCTDVVGCRTHFVNNRTIPCEGEDTCPWDAEGHSWRWHGYVSAVLCTSLEHVLFEFTATASDTFKNYNLLHGTIRGCKFLAHRPSKRHNGRVVVACQPVDVQRVRLPDPPDIRAILCHVWNVQYDKAEYAGRVRFPFKEIGVLPSDNDGRNRP